MAQADGVVANGTGAAVRSDLNGQLAALFTNHSGSTEPGTTYAYQWWADTNANVLKIRNSSNDGWITLRELDGTMLIEDGSASTPGLAFADDVNTGIFSPAADQIGFATGGAERLEIGSSEVVFNDPSNDVDFRVESNGQTHMLFVDGGNDRVGIGTNGPGTVLDVAGSNPTLRVRATTINTEVTTIRATETDSFVGAYLKYDGSTNLTHIGTHSAADSDAANDNNAISIVRDDRNVGIGTSSPAGKLTVASRFDLQNSDTTNDRTIFAFDTNNLEIETRNGTGIIFKTNQSERARITSGGRLGIGTSSPLARTHLDGTDNDTDNVLFLSAANLANGAGGRISFGGNYDGTNRTSWADIKGSKENATSGEYGGYLSFSTRPNGGSNTERMRITPSGYFKAANNGSYQAASVSRHEFNQSANENNLVLHCTNTGYTSDVSIWNVNKAANSNYGFLRCYSNTFADTEYLLRGDGQAYADGSWNGGGADYAEYFEWSDGNTEAEDRRGVSVVLDGDKIREAVTGEEPIGVISGNASVVGDADMDRWKHKYLRDDYGSYALDEDGYRQLNPDYDSSVQYVQREDRPEWDTVGLMGKLRIRKGQVTGTRWIKMRDVSDTVEEWLVR